MQDLPFDWREYALAISSLPTCLQVEGAGLCFRSKEEVTLSVSLSLLSPVFLTIPQSSVSSKKILD